MFLCSLATILVRPESKFHGGLKDQIIRSQVIDSFLTLKAIVQHSKAMKVVRKTKQQFKKLVLC